MGTVCLSKVKWGPGISGSRGITDREFRVYLKYELGVVPKAFLNMEMKALGVL